MTSYGDGSDLGLFREEIKNKKSRESSEAKV